MVELLDPTTEDARGLVGLPLTPADNTLLRYDTASGVWEAATGIFPEITGLGVQAQDLDMGTQQIKAVVDPTLAQDAATKNYVDTTALTNSLTDSFIFVGNGSNVAIGVAVSGDITISNTGVVTIGNDKITTVKILDLNVTLGKLAADSVDSSKIVNDSIVNVDINSGAAIAYSKLNLTDSILNADINSGAAIAYSKLNLTTSIINGDLAGGVYAAITGLGVQAQVLDMGTNKVTNAGAPTLGNDLTTKSYVDNLITGMSWKDPTRAATTATIADLSNASVTIDGVTLIQGERVLVKDTASPDGIIPTGAEYNGIYIVGVVGAGFAPFTRALDFDASSEIVNAAMWVSEGTANADQAFVCTTDAPIVVDTTLLTFVQFSGLGQIIAGAGLTKTANTLDVIGTTNRILVNADSVDISPNYVGQATITTLGTIATGVWNGTSIAYTNLTLTGSVVNADLASGVFGAITGVGAQSQTLNMNTNSISGIVNLNSIAITDYAINTDNLSFFASTTSAQLAGVISDETGSGLLVFGTSPTIVTPTIASFTNATHDHEDALGGGTLDSKFALSDTANIVYNNQNNDLNAFYLDIDGIAVPANPAAAHRRLFVDTADGILKVRTPGGATVSLEAGAAGGEVNTHSSVGGGTFALTAAVPKVASNLQLISISNGDGINAALATDVLTLAVSATVVQTDQINTFGDFDQTFKDNRIVIESPDGLTPVTLINSQQTLARNLTIPILTGNDILATLGLANVFTDTQTIPTLEISGGIKHSVLGKVFDEYFAGIAVSAIWNTTDISGVNTFGFSDGLGGGATIVTAGANGNRGNYDFNNLGRHFDLASCTIYGIFKADSIADIFLMIGLSDDTDNQAGDNQLAVVQDSAATNFIHLRNGNGTTIETNASDVAESTNSTPYKIVSDGSDVFLFLLVGGVWTLKVTASTFLPTGASQPFIHCQTRTSATKKLTCERYRVQNDD